MPDSMTRAAALAVVLLGATFFAGGTTGGVNATSANPTVVVPLGTQFQGLCELVGGQVDGRISYWEVDGVIPAFRKAARGVVLAPPAEELPRPGKGPTGEPFQGQWLLEPRLMASPIDSSCAVRTFDPLQAVTLEQPGPHVFVQYNQTVSFVRVDSNEAPTPQPCQGNDPDFPDPTSDIPPPAELPDDKIWAVAHFCNRTDVRGLYVTGTAQCSAKGDMSGWPSMPYINQYDAGARLNLPVRLGYRGGNACGPSSLLMAMLRSAGAARGLPKLVDVFDATMQLNRIQVQPDGENAFVGGLGEALLETLGWRSADVVALTGDVETRLKRILSALARGPIVISTAFGTSRWGATGGGHMIAVVAADARGNFIVEDPAGNWFASPKGSYFSRGGHYGPGSCGHLALYPLHWLMAYTTGRWMLTLGRRSPPSRPFATSHKALQPLARRPSPKPKFGTAIAIYDAHAGKADAPRTFYLQGAARRRAGWIGGQAVERLPNASASQDTPGWTTPALGDASIAPWPDTVPAMPRIVVVRSPARGIGLFVSATKGRRYALVVRALRDGVVVTKAVVRGIGKGRPERVSSPALSALR